MSYALGSKHQSGMMADVSKYSRGAASTSTSGRPKSPRVSSPASSARRPNVPSINTGGGGLTGARATSAAAAKGRRYGGAVVSNASTASNAATTPRTTRGAFAAGSSAAGGSSPSEAAGVELDTVLQEVVGVRMQSLGDLRRRIDELSGLHRREEEVFKREMRRVLHQSTQVRATQAESEATLQSALAQERAERGQILGLMRTFKADGAAVIAGLKESLADVHSKWKAEVDKNAKLAAQLRRHNANHHANYRSTSSTSSVHHHDPGNSDSDRTLLEKVAVLKDLLEEEDSVIMELRQRNKALEGRIHAMALERERLLDSDASFFASSEVTQDQYHDLLAAVRRIEVDGRKRSNHAPKDDEKEYLEGGDADDDETGAGTASLEQVATLKQFSAVLMQRLRAEQQQRLRAEEQATRMAAAQDEMIRNLEDKVRAHEGAPAGTPRQHPTAGTPRQQQHHSVSKSEINSNGKLPAASGKRIVPPLQVKSHHAPHHDQMEQGDFGENDNEPLMHVDISSITAESADSASAATVTGGRGATSERRADAAARSGGATNTSSPSPATPSANTSAHTNAADDGSVGHHHVVAAASLEDQLATINKEFEESLQMWSETMNGGPAVATTSV